MLWANGRRDSAGAQLRAAVDRDPTSPDRLFDAWTYAQQTGNVLEAREYCGRLGELHAGDLCSALQDLDVKRPERALELLQHAANDAGTRRMHPQLDYVAALVTADKMADARNVVAAVDRQAATPGTYMREDDIALMHGLLGDTDGAMRWYERALSSGSSGIGSLYWRSIRNPIRKDPRLLEFAKRAGLQSPPAYWP